MNNTAPKHTEQNDHSPNRAAAGIHYERFTRWIIGHKKIIFSLWIVIFVLGGISTASFEKRLSYNFALPGQPGYATSQIINQVWGNGGANPPAIAVITASGGQSVTPLLPKLAHEITILHHEDSRVRIVGYPNTHNPALLLRHQSITYLYLFTPPVNGLGASTLVPQLGKQLQQALPGTTVTLTGINQLATGSGQSGNGVLVETVLGGVGALAVLALVFASILAFIPLLVAAIAILATFLVLLGLSQITSVSFVVQFLVSLVGLGIAIDYSLLIVTRWREERNSGLSNDEAVLKAMSTAGRSVVVSGLTVAVGLIALVVLPVPLLRSTGLGGMLIPLTSIAVSMTLLPALLSGIGPRIDWPHRKRTGGVSRLWLRWTHGVVKHRWVAAIAALVILGILSAPLRSIQLGQTNAASQSQHGAAITTYRSLVSDGVPPGVLTPIEVLVKTAQQRSVTQEVRSLRLGGPTLLASGQAGTRFDPTLHTSLTDILAIPGSETIDNASLGPVRTTSTDLNKQAGVLGVSGFGANQSDFIHATYGNLIELIAILAILEFIILARSFRSVLLSLKAVILNLLGLGATFGFLTWFWQEGHGSQSLFSIGGTGAITSWVPITVFAFLFGLSMDYEVFILTRVREEYDQGSSTDEAVEQGLARVGKLVTSAALILFLAFASLSSAPNTDVKILATGLGVGILLDATIIRAILVPALVSLFGTWNWWLPTPLQRLLRIAPTT
ncbi:MAG: MMPL family transporter [Acidimicrobiales bacterium]